MVAPLDTKTQQGEISGVSYREFGEAGCLARWLHQVPEHWAQDDPDGQECARFWSLAARMTEPDSCRWFRTHGDHWQSTSAI